MSMLDRLDEYIMEKIVSAIITVVAVIIVFRILEPWLKTTIEPHEIKHIVVQALTR